MVGEWERTRANQTEGKWELQAKAELERGGRKVVILWERCDPVHATEQGARDIKRQYTQRNGMAEPDQGEAQVMKSDGEGLSFSQATPLSATEGRGRRREQIQLHPEVAEPGQGRFWCLGDLITDPLTSGEQGLESGTGYGRLW